MQIMQEYRASGSREGCSRKKKIKLIYHWQPAYERDRLILRITWHLFIKHLVYLSRLLEASEHG